MSEFENKVAVVTWRWRRPWEIPCFGTREARREGCGK
jgi:hypothetical protein